jgi:hypothetical protein
LKEKGTLALKSAQQLFLQNLDHQRTFKHSLGSFVSDALKAESLGKPCGEMASVGPASLALEGGPLPQMEHDLEVGALPEHQQQVLDHLDTHLWVAERAVQEWEPKPVDL